MQKDRRYVYRLLRAVCVSYHARDASTELGHKYVLQVAVPSCDEEEFLTSDGTQFLCLPLRKFKLEPFLSHHA